MVKVLINTSPLLNSKTGIGYCVYNLVERLVYYENIEVVCSHKPAGIIIGKLINSLMKLPKRVLKNMYPEKLASLAYNMVLCPFSLEAHSKLFENSTPDVDIYHETRHSMILNLAHARKRPKLLVDIHDFSPITHPEWHRAIHVNEVKRAMLHLLNADMFTVKSNYILNEFVELYGISKKIVHVTPNAVGTAYQKTDIPDAKRKKLEKKLGMDANKPFVLYTGTIEPRKNLLTLIDAFCSVRERYDINLILAGGLGWHYNQILEAVSLRQRQGDILITGYLPEDDFLCLYNMAYIYVYPSFYEGFGIPPLEAMSCGLPVIVSDAASLPEVVGDAALKFSPNSSEELSFQIEVLLNDNQLRTNLIERGFKRASEFNWDATVAQIVNIYRSMV